jgi:hypothetical protein
MSTADQLNGASCPVSGTKMDERVARVIAAQVVVMISLSLVSPFFPVAILLLDFTFRAFFAGKGSAFRWIACRIVHFLPGTPKPTDVAPKRFAALLGFLFSALILSLHLLDLHAIAYALSLLLLVLATLEATIALCVGCIIYQQIQIIRGIQTS